MTILSRPLMAAVGLILVASAGSSSCGDSSPQLLSIPVTGGSLLEGARFQAADGSHVTLTEARVTWADLRLEMPAEEVARGDHWIESGLSFGVAQAHPGHDFSGNVAGELLGTFSLDLLAEAEELGKASVYEGTLATAHLELPGGEASGGTVVAALAGSVVTSDGTHRLFDFQVTMDETVEGIPCEATIQSSAPPAELRLEVDVAHMLSFVQWSTEDEDGDGVLTLADGDLGNTVPFGVRATPAYRLTFLP